MSFNIGRLRKVGEPITAAWNGSADDGRPISFVDSLSTWTKECGPKTGCYLFRRIDEGDDTGTAIHEQEREVEQKRWEEELEMCVDEENDATYQCPNESDDPYEYNSTDADESDRGSDVDMEDDKSQRSGSRLYQEWKDVFNSPEEKKPQKVEESELLEMPAVDTDESIQGMLKGEDLEHIAGPKCANTGGYNPHAISVEEMRGCKTVQCLVVKDQHWRPEPDDEDFELSSNYFLTGISDHVPSRDTGSLEVFPVRHFQSSPFADVWIVDPGEATAMPIHPSCFEIFKHQSRQRLGGIDVNGLMGWWKVEDSYEDAYEFPRHKDVSDGDEQWWCHHRGSEYLAANPVFVPGLKNLLLPAISTSPSFSVEDSAFSGGLNLVKTIDPANDPFLRLPQELKFYLLDHLSSPDIANLRLCSRGFYQLPVSLWHRLLVDEMPWLWEVDENSLPPSFWARVTVPQLRARKSAKDAYEAQLLRYRKVIAQEMPELQDVWERAEPAFEDFADPLEMPEPPVRLPKDRTNWYLVYRNVAMRGKHMKGLQNRRRIWIDVEEIIWRIQKHRDEGKIVD